MHAIVTKTKGYSYKRYLVIVAIILAVIALVSCDLTSAKTKEICENGYALAQAGDYEAAIQEFEQIISDPDAEYMAYACEQAIKGEYSAMVAAFDLKFGSAHITIPAGTTEIPDRAFEGSVERLTGVSIPDSVTTIGASAFVNCEGLEQVTIPDSVTSIGEDAFSWCVNLKNVTLSASLTNISDGVFSNCLALESVVIPDGVTTIGVSAFISCEALAQVTIPASVTMIDEFAFEYCSGLNSLTYEGTVEQWKTITLQPLWSDFSAITVIHCTDGDVVLE
jgi:hypothetical protein